MKLFLKYQNCDTLDDTFFLIYIYIYWNANILDESGPTIFNLWNFWFRTWARDIIIEPKSKQIRNHYSN